MLETLTYLYEKIHEVWSVLIYDLMIYEHWSDPSHALNNIIDGDLLKINLIWEDLPSVLSAITVVLLIYLFIKFFVKLLGVFVWK